MLCGVLNNAVTVKGYTVLKDRQVYEYLIYKNLEAGVCVWHYQDTVHVSAWRH